jgi:hypothetical protein
VIIGSVLLASGLAIMAAIVTGVRDSYWLLGLLSMGNGACQIMMGRRLGGRRGHIGGT